MTYYGQLMSAFHGICSMVRSGKLESKRAGLVRIPGRPRLTFAEWRFPRNCSGCLARVIATSLFASSEPYDPYDDRPRHNTVAKFSSARRCRAEGDRRKCRGPSGTYNKTGRPGQLRNQTELVRFLTGCGVLPIG